MVNIPYNRYRRTRWQRFKFRVKDTLGAALTLGGLGAVFAVILGLILLPLLWFGLVAYVVIHFVQKFW